MIPKYIYQTFSHERDLDEAHRANIEQMRALNPGWDYRLFDDTECRDFIRRHYDGRLLGLYDRINPAYGPARADFFRYMLLYELGGVYLDIKSGLRRPLDSVLRADDVYMLSHWKNAPGEAHAGWGVWPELMPRMPRGEYVNWYIIAAPRHPYLKYVIERIAERIERYVAVRDGVGRSGVVRTTGPVAYSMAIADIRDAHPHRQVEFADLGLVYSIFEAKGVRLAHAGYTQRHYSTLTEPIVSVPTPSQGEPVEPSWRAIGRNEPCPCGSGEKYKHCHGAL